MIPTISMSLWQRPEYTRQVLQALRDGIGASKYRLVVAIDVGVGEWTTITCQDGKKHNVMRRYGSNVNQEVLDIVNAQTWPVEKEIHVMPSAAGCNSTIRCALEHAFTKADYVIHVEDDIVLAGDAIPWFEWARDQYRDDPSVFTVTAWRHPDGWLPENHRDRSIDEHCVARREAFFTCWGWATWLDRWNEIKPKWSDKGDYEVSWDVRMSELRGNRVQIAPLIGRASNIGVLKGTHRGHVPLSYWRGQDSVEVVPDFKEA